MAEELLLTQEGYDKIVAEHEELVSVRRKEISEKLKEAISYAASAPSGHRRAGKTDPARTVLPVGRPPLPSNRKGHSTLARFGQPATPEMLPAPARILSQPEMSVHRFPMRSFFAPASTWLLSDLRTVNHPFSKE